MQTPLPGRAWVEVDLDAVRANLQVVRRLAGPAAGLIPMVKADGYGLGAARIVRALEPLSPWGYGVATAEEGIEVRGVLRALRGDAGAARPVVVFSPLPAASMDAAAGAGLTATISDVAMLEAWSAAAERAATPLAFHVEVDTGMGRAGFDWRQTPTWAPAVAARAGRLHWTGVYTHFHGADGPDPSSAAAQWQRFQDALLQLPVSREDLLVHAANSAAAVRWPAYAADAVRPGIFLYGGDPAPGVPRDVPPRPSPVASVRARVTLVREVPPGSTAGYGATYVARNWERWATVGIGYGDGWPRILGNRGEALVRGRRVPLIGRVSMDMVVIDVTQVPEAQAGDVATLLGEDGGERITLEDVATRAETISYEILTGLTARLPRVEVARGGG